YCRALAEGAVQSKIPAWVPATVKQEIAELGAWPYLSPQVQAALERLAIRDEMRVIWARLPSQPQSGRIISLVLHAFEPALELEPPRSNHAAALIEHLRRYRKVTYLGIAGLARALRENLDATTAITRARWKEAHSGEAFEVT